MKISPFKIEEWMNIYEKSAKYDLTTTCIKPLSIRELCAFSGIKPEIYDIPMDYGAIEGSNRLKEGIQTLYSSIEGKSITVTHGAIGANQLIFLSLLEREDEVISIIPTYQQHYSIPESIGAKVNLLFLEEDDNWLPNLNKLNALVNRNTKLICLNNPNNPTGAVIPDNMLEEICEIAKKNNVWILADEVYRGLNLYGNPYSTSIAEIYDKGISVGSMSKTYSLPGLRVGWIVAREDLINEINHQRQYNTISISIIDDYFASIALEHRDIIVDRNLQILKKNEKLLANWLTQNKSIKCILPKGGTTSLLRYNKDIPSRKLCRYLQSKTGVALLPGETMEMEGYVRIGFASKDLENGLNLFGEYLNSI